MSSYQRKVKLDLSNLLETSKHLREKADYQTQIAQLLNDAAEVMEKIEELENDLPGIKRKGWTPERRAHQARLMTKVNKKLGRTGKKKLMFVERKPRRIERKPRKRRILKCRALGCGKRILNTNMGNHMRYDHGVSRIKNEVVYLTPKGSKQ